MTDSAYLIFNPVAGQTDPDQDLEIITNQLQPALNLEICFTTPDVDAEQLAQTAVAQGAKMIIASGGDGTISAAASAVVGTGIPFGIISRGTANAFANALGIPMDIESACRTILQGVTRVVDTATCNGKTMTLLAGIGFEAETVSRANRELKKRLGILAYILAGFQELNNLELFETQLETEDKILTVEAAAVTIANIAPPTSVLAQGPNKLIADDGLLDVTIVAPNNTLGAIAAAYNLLQSAYRSESVERPDTGYFRTRWLKITTNPPQKVVIDGEIVGETPVEIECVPGGLNIFVPQDPAPDSPDERLEGLPNLQVKAKDTPTHD